VDFPKSGNRLTLEMGARQLAKARTRERVRTAAHDLFVTRGWADTTAQLIAEAAGVAVGTVFQHASDKEDLLLLVLHDPLAEALASAVGRPAASDVLTDLTLLFGAVLDVYADLGPAARPAVRAAWFASGPNARAVQWMHETLLDQVTVRLERAQQARTLTAGADVRLLADNLSAIHRAVLLDWVSTDENVDAAVRRLRAAFALQIIPLQTTTPGAPA
jgi:AcrR family transcriptional regulator